MKKYVIITLVSLLTIPAMAQKKEEAKVKAVVEQFAGNADKQDAAAMKSVLHDNFRAVVNRAFGAEDVSIMDKPAYLQLLTDKKIGGDARKVTFSAIDINGNNASVKAIFQGEKLTFTTYLLLVKETSGEWKLISDMPVIEKP